MYALAHNLIGFSNDGAITLRVRIERVDGNSVFCRTADLRDAGTPLVLDRSQVEMEAAPGGAVRHTTGLCAMEG